MPFFVAGFSNVKKYFAQLLLWFWFMVLLGCWLRVSTAFTSTIWYDEAYSGTLMRFSQADMWQAIFNDVHPPLYLVLLRIWSFITSDSLFALRLFSVFVSFLTFLLIPWFYQTFFTPFSRSTPSYLPLVLAFAVLPFWVDYGAEARGYALLLFFSLGLLALFWNIKTKNTPSMFLFLYSLALIATAMTHYIGFVVSGLVVLSHACFFVNSRQKPNPEAILTAYGIPFLGVILWFPALLVHFGSGGLGWVPVASFDRTISTILAFLYGSSPHQMGAQGFIGFDTFPDLFSPVFSLFSAYFIVLLLGGFVFLLFFASLAFFAHQNQQPAQWLCCFTLFGFLSIFLLSFFDIIHLYEPRYLLVFGFLALSILFGFFLSLWNLNRLLLGLIGVILLLPFGFLSDKLSEPPYHKIAAQLLDAPIGKIYVDDPVHFVIFRYLTPTKEIKLLESTTQDYGQWAAVPYHSLTPPAAVAHAAWVVASADRPPDQIKNAIIDREIVFKKERFTVFDKSK